MGRGGILTYSEHEPLIRVMALHALAYCERLFYLEEVEEIRLADTAIFAGRTLHEELKQEEEKQEPVPEGRVRYHSENITVRVPLDEAARSSVNYAITRSRELRTSPNRP